jgi:phospholipid/cholesterol/gamma-HCH transport system substrate-binding protein
VRRSRQVTWDQVRVGLVLIFAILVLSMGVFLIGRTGNVFGERYQVVTLMSSAAGLVGGAPVQVAGQTAGQVDRIEFIEPERRPETGETVAVWLDLNVDIRQQVRTDSRARVRTQGLLGDRLIDIEPGTAAAAVLMNGDTLASAPALSYQEILGQAADAVDGLTRLSSDLAEVTERLLAGEGTAGQLLVDPQLYDELVTLGANLNSVLGPIAAGEGMLGRLLQEEELYERLTTTARGLDSLTAGLVAGEGTLGRLMTSDSLYLALATVAERSDSLVAALRAGEGSMGQMLTDEALYEELLKTLVDLNALLDDLRADPRRFIPPVRVF